LAQSRRLNQGNFSFQKLLIIFSNLLRNKQIKGKLLTMRKTRGEIVVLLLLLLTCSALCADINEAADSNTVAVLFSDDVNSAGPQQFPQAGNDSAKAVIIPCKKMIDDGLFKSIKRRTEEALAGGVDYIIYEVDTYGGDLFSAIEISNYLLRTANDQTHTVAYVVNKAISAGAMVSVSCQDIVMENIATIGDCAPIQLGGKLEGVQREKVESPTRAIFENAAITNGYPEALLKAMVSIGHEVYRVKNLSSGDYEFFEKRDLPVDANSYDLAGKSIIVKEGELLTLTASKAMEYGIARKLVKDIDGVLLYLSDRDQVVFQGRPEVLETNWSEEMVRWINSPAVMSILVLLVMVGAYLELNSPGLGLPGLIALISLIIIIGSKYLIGLANWVEVAMFIVGLVLLCVEVFVLPGFGIAGILGIIFIVIGFLGMLVKNPPDRFPWPDSTEAWRLFSDGIMGITAGFLPFIVLAIVFARYLPKIKLMSGLVLTPSTPKSGDEVEISVTYPPEAGDVILKVGDIGEVVTKLRPAGTAKFGLAVVDVVSTAEYLDKGVEVEIIDLRGNRVIVRAVTKRE